MKNWIRKNKINILITLFYAIISFILISFHEPWRDEAQSWLIVRDLKFTEIIQQLKYEGHFMLWYIILLPFAKLGFPYITINIISWIISVISTWLIVSKAPFKSWFKILFVFSMPMIYLYPSISRCYCLIPLSISLIAITYKNRKSNPILYILAIVLLINTHVIMLGLAGILLLVFILEEFKDIKQKTKEERKKLILSLIIGAITSILSIFPLIESMNVNQTVGLQFTDFNSFKKYFLNNLILIIYNITCINFKTIEQVLIVVFVLVGFIIYCMQYEYKKNFKNLVILIVSISYQILLYTCIYNTSPQKASTIIFIVFLIFWIQKENPEDSKIVRYSNRNKIMKFGILLLLVVHIILGIRLYIINEIKYNYSSAKDTALFINNNISENAVITCNNMPYISAIIPYVNNISFYSLQEEKIFSYVTWNGNEEVLLNSQYLDKIKELKKENNETYYILPKKDKDEYIEQLEEQKIFIPIFESDNSLQGESYTLYRINI